MNETARGTRSISPTISRRVSRCLSKAVVGATIDKLSLGALGSGTSGRLSLRLNLIDFSRPRHRAVELLNPHQLQVTMSTHRADASTLLDNRGYTGPLVRGVNPATLFEKAVRDRITDSYYWKEQCFGLNAATLCDRAVELTSIGGTYGVSEKPTAFLCLAFKMLQINPSRDIVLEYLNFTDPGSDDEGEGEATAEDQAENGAVKERGDFKYLRALAAFYARLTFDAVDVYKALEPLLLDYRKLKRRVRESFMLTYMDQFVDDLLTKDRVCGTSLWKLPPRQQLEDLDLLDERISPLAGELGDMDEDNNGEEEGEASDAGSAKHSGED